ncbi:MAG: M15 family metallopeptidase [Myxococcota bacterium]|nr:M15 family metallopeptidase [Myxococcota bacterium]
MLPPSFIDLSNIPEFKLQIYYATPHNFTNQVLPGYEFPGAWLHRDAAERLLSLRTQLQKLNLKMVIWDAYRPKRATDAMVRWANNTGNAWMVEEGYIARRSRHNGGVAIDVGLLRDNVPLDMGTEWDFFGDASHIQNATGVALENRYLLHGLMSSHGWIGYQKEWWHFEILGAQDYPSFDMPYVK